MVKKVMVLAFRADTRRGFVLKIKKLEEDRDL